MTEHIFPENWYLKQLSEVGSLATGSTPKTTESENFGGFIPFIKPADFYPNGELDYNNAGLSEVGLHKTRRKIGKDSILMVCIGATIGKVGFCVRDVSANQQINALTPSSNFDCKFIYYQMLQASFQRTVLSSSGQATLPIINKSKWGKLSLVFPPLPEQKRIVAILDEAFAGIDQAIANTERNLVNARELFDSYLNEVFTRKGEGWEEKTIEEITSHLGDGLHGTPQYSDDGEYYFINGNNLNNGSIEFKERTKKVDHNEYLKYKKKLTNRTVLVSINGTLGKVAFYNNEKVILGKSACYFNLNNDVNKNYIKHLLSSPIFIQYAHEVATGATIKNVSLKSMRKFKVPLPEADEQELLVIQIDELQRNVGGLASTYRQKLTSLTELKQSLLQKAFTGELTADWREQQT